MLTDAYKITHLKLNSTTDIATVQTWLDNNYPLVVTQIFINGLDVYILYT